MKEFSVYGHFGNSQGNWGTPTKKIDRVNISSSSPAAAAQLVVDRMKLRGLTFEPILVFSGSVRELWRAEK